MRAAAQDAQADPPAEELDAVIVTGRRVPDAMEGASGTATALRDVPQAVSVVDESVFSVQQPLSLTDILRNTPSISNFRNGSETFRTVSLRGFVQNETSVDGLRNTDALNIQPDGLASIQRVEVIRGPAAALYGRGSLGGAINIVTKKPEDAFSLRGHVDVGDPRLHGAMLDVTGPVGEQVSARVVAAAERRDSFIDFTDIDAVQIAPSVRWSWGGGSALLQADYRRREQLRYIGLPTYGTVFGLDDLELDIGANFGEPALPETENKGLQVTASVEQAMSPTWSLSGAVRYTENTYDQAAVSLRALGADRRTLARGYNRFDEAQDEQAMFLTSINSFTTGPLSHQLRIGLEHARFTYDSVFYSGSIAPIDIRQPVYGAMPTGIFVLDDTTDFIRGTALSVQDQITVTPRLKLLAGGRLDRIDTRRRSNVDGGEGRRTVDAFSPRAGATFDLRERATLYASWGRNIEAQNNGGSNATLTPFEPVRGKQVEAGIKLVDRDEVSATFGVYRIDATGVLTTDPDDPNGFSIPTGERRSQGIEAELSWQPLPGLTLVGYAAHTDAEIVADTNFASGTPIQNVPRRSARMFALYEHGSGWGINGAVTYQSEQQGNLAGTFTLPGSTILDAGVSYRTGPLTFALQARNLTDRRHFIRGAFDGRNIVPGDPRTLFFRVAYAFDSGPRR